MHNVNHASAHAPSEASHESGEQSLKSSVIAGLGVKRYVPTVLEQKIINKANIHFIGCYISGITLGVLAGLRISRSVPSSWKGMSIFISATLGEVAGRKVGEFKAGYELMRHLPSDSELRALVGKKFPVISQSTVTIPNDTAMHDYSLEGSVPAPEPTPPTISSDSQPVPPPTAIGPTSDPSLAPSTAWNKVRSDHAGSSASVWDRIRAGRSVPVTVQPDGGDEVDEWRVGKQGEMGSGVSKTVRRNAYGDVID